MIYTLYKKETGEIIGHKQCNADLVLDGMDDNIAFIDGLYNGNDYIVINNVVTQKQANDNE
jgi:hypothetical protein